jgi:PAS domain S-box-containing protein
MSANVPTLLATYQLRQREYLLRITRAMNSRLELPGLLDLILRGAADMVGAPAGLIVLRPENPSGTATPGAARFQARALYNIPRDTVEAFEPLFDVQTVFAVQQAATNRGAADQPPTVDLTGPMREVEEALGVPLGQVVALPLLFEEELLGIIYLFRGNYAFTPLDWQFLQGFADQAAVAVRNARLYTLLAAERRRLATILENSADGIMILTADRQVIAINNTLAEMVGMEPEDAVGRPCSSVLPLENVTGRDFCADQSYMGDFPEAIARCEGELIRPGDRRLVLAVTYTPLRSESGRLLNVIVNVHDITRFREEEEMKSTFTSIISHELKTPVALIKGYAQTLARPDARWDAATARHGLEIIEEEADRLELLIDNLLDASRIQAQGLTLELADVNVAALLRRVVQTYSPHNPNHRFELELPATLPVVWGDEERLRQVVTNLLNNALKYSPEGGAIRVGARPWAPDAGSSDPLTTHLAGETRPLVVFWVADQGVGIPASDLPHIFDRYYRVDSSLRRTTPGAGLGLYLAQAIVTAHGGRIWVASEPGKGATFYVSLPVDSTPAV